MSPLDRADGAGVCLHIHSMSFTANTDRFTASTDRKPYKTNSECSWSQNAALFSQVSKINMDIKTLISKTFPLDDI